MDKDDMDTPMPEFDRNDSRFESAAQKMLIATLGVDLAHVYFQHRYYGSAKQILEDCRNLVVESIEIIEEMGAYEEALMTAKALDNLDERIAQVDEAIKAYGGEDQLGEG